MRSVTRKRINPFADRYLKYLLQLFVYPPYVDQLPISSKFQLKYQKQEVAPCHKLFRHHYLNIVLLSYGTGATTDSQAVYDRNPPRNERSVPSLSKASFNTGSFMWRADFSRTHEVDLRRETVLTCYC